MSEVEKVQVDSLPHVIHLSPGSPPFSSDHTIIKIIRRVEAH